MKKIPQIKKEIKHFIADESGVISKEAILKTGIVLSGVLAMSATVSADHVSSTPHTNSLTSSFQDDQAVANHNHHAQHSEGC